MKRHLIALLCTLLAVSSNAQILPEYTFTGLSVAYTQLPIAGYKFYAMDATNSKCIFYNADHSVWKSVSLSVPTNHYLVDLAYVSEDLFNNDNAIELLYVTYYYDSNLGYGTYETRIANESGTVLLSVPGGGYSAVYNAQTGAKLFVWVYDYSQTITTVTTKVYTIPGQIATSIATQPINPSPKVSAAYPNPSSGQVTIPYELPAQIDEAVLRIIDEQGKTIQSYRIDHTFSDLVIPTGMLPKGFYVYRIESSNFTSNAKKLIIN